MNFALKRLLYGASLVTVLTLGISPPVAGQVADRFTVDWAPCPTAPTKQCGAMQVPIDWSKHAHRCRRSLCRRWASGATPTAR